MPEDDSQDEVSKEEWYQLNETARPLIDVADLDSVRTVRAEVELLDSEVAENLDFDETAMSATAQVSLAPGALHYRISYEAVFTDSDENDGVRVALDIVVAFTMPQDFTPTSEQVGAVAATLIPGIVHPYQREGFSSLLARVGLPGITVGLIKFPPRQRPAHVDEESALKASDA